MFIETAPELQFKVIEASFDEQNIFFESSIQFNLIHLFVNLNAIT